MESGEAPRIDKWLWAVRVFKTRSLATQACKTGRVKVDELPVKPSREVRRDMVISIHTGPIVKTIKVVELLHNRVGAKLVNEYMLDLTPPEEYAKLELIKQQPFRRQRGSGRPTKKERRDMDTWLGWD
ncbi:MAG: RNA-binding S4 domain-containing protein [Bacteroides sp.]|jgi:ribosome-associated heat shock protein Hsp15|nr:RNA-binding S4 domain-containing protein [Bacteroides sp.]